MFESIEMSIYTFMTNKMKKRRAAALRIFWPHNAVRAVQRFKSKENFTTKAAKTIDMYRSPKRLF